ncbi:hypothetical protein A8135_00060 [Legionella jamestowniensis]|uniref:F-box domain-containing protein n=1 Tax=Legionella jamestowniensis TaxID=455 RepID=A0ABX2XX89_9GAMM|nr:hypothetical protein [Legionella jamestowniensis]OCH98474.1 hypothetical protein A8135_00060 [Legionella jamestowniensis]
MPTHFDFFANIPHHVLVDIYSHMTADKILKSGMANKKHHAAAIEALFKKDDEQAQKRQLLLLKKWIREGNSISIPQNDNIIWDAIKRTSSDPYYCWHGLLLLATKNGIDLSIHNNFFSLLSDYFFKEEYQAATYSVNRLMALYFFSCFADTAAPEQQLIILGILTHALYDQDEAVADCAWQVFQKITIVIPKSELDYYASESIKLVKKSEPLTLADQHHMAYFLPLSKGKVRSELLNFLNQSHSETIKARQLLVWQYLATKKLSKKELKSAFAFVWKSLKAEHSIPTKKTALKTLSALIPQLSGLSLSEAILEIRSILECSSEQLIQLVLETVLKNNIPVIASHALFPKIIEKLFKLINSNAQNSKVPQLAFKNLALAASYLDKEVQQEAIHITAKTINENQDPEILKAAFETLSSYSHLLSNKQIDKFFNQAVYYAQSDGFFDFALQILIALSIVLTSEKTDNAIRLIVETKFNIHDYLADIVSLKLTFFSRLAKKLEEKHLEAVNQVILEGLDQYDSDLALDVFQIFLPILNQKQRQIFFQKAMHFFDSKDSTTQRIALEIINIMHSYLSIHQVQQYTQKPGFLIPNESDAEDTTLYLKNMALLFNKVNRQTQALIINLLCQATHHSDHLVRGSAVHSFIHLVIRGNIDKENIKNTLPEPEGEFINYFLAGYAHIKQAEASPTLNYRNQCLLNI